MTERIIDIELDDSLADFCGRRHRYPLRRLLRALAGLLAPRRYHLR